MDDNLFILIKSGFAAELEKAGSSLEEFEAALAEADTQTGQEKTAGIGGAILGWMAKLTGAALTKIPEIGWAGALGAGSAIGAGAYGAHRYIDNQNKELEAKQEEMRRIKSMTEQLKGDYGVQ